MKCSVSGGTIVPSNWLRLKDPNPEDYKGLSNEVLANSMMDVGALVGKPGDDASGTTYGLICNRCQAERMLTIASQIADKAAVLYGMTPDDMAKGKAAAAMAAAAFHNILHENAPEDHPFRSSVPINPEH